MTDKEKEKEKKSRFERFADWGYKWRMKPYKMFAKNVTEGIKEGVSDEGKSTEDAIAVLKLRLAKGEISKEQYEELKKAIENK